MKFQELNQFFEKSPEAQQALVNNLSEAGLELEKVGNRLREKGINPDDHLEVLHYGMVVGMFSGLSEIGLGIDLDGDEKKEVIEKAKIEVEKAECTFPLDKK